MPHPKRERGIGKNERKKNERKREGPFVMKAWAPPFDVVSFSSCNFRLPRAYLSSTFKGVFKQNLMLKTPISSSKPRKAPPNYKSYLVAIKTKQK